MARRPTRISGTTLPMLDTGLGSGCVIPPPSPSATTSGGQLGLGVACTIAHPDLLRRDVLHMERRVLHAV